jgi:hypothetical protein
MMFILIFLNFNEYEEKLEVGENGSGFFFFFGHFLCKGML